MVIRQATYSDIESLMKVFEGAKRIMRESGNLHQWTDGYPSEDVVRRDIESGYCYVVCEGDDILATIALIHGPEPTYTYIEGKWPDDAPYYVIHRLAASAPGKNMARKIFDWAFKYIANYQCNTIRIDTHHDNSIMKHILRKYGFSECGIIYLENGDARDAYHLNMSVNISIHERAEHP